MSMILFVELNGAIECGNLWKMIELAPHDTSLDSCNHLHVERLNHMLIYANILLEFKFKCDM
jgi:hypothetical protein